MRSPLERTRRGGYRVRLSAEEREVLRALPAQLREVLDTDDPSVRRLFPPAYDDDPEREAEYRSMVRDELVRDRLRALETVESTLDAEVLDEEQVSAWLGVLNDLRLVLGTRLDVTEEMQEEGLAEDDPRLPAFALYRYLSWLQEHVVAALAG